VSDAPSGAPDDDTVRRLTGEEYAFERVGPGDLSAGDRLLVFPDEPLPVDGRVEEVLDGADTPDVEAADGSSRPVTAGASVSADELLRGSPVVVTYRGAGAVPFVGSAVTTARAAVGVNRRHLVAVFALLVVVSAAGIGLVGDLPDGDSTDGVMASGTNPEEPTPEPPDVTVDVDDGDGTSTPERPPTETPTADKSGSETVTTTEASSDDEDGDDPADDVGAGIAIEASDPATVRSVDGRVDVLTGDVVGTASWSGGRVTAVVFVVNTWTPTDGWQETRRTTIASDSPVGLSDVFEGSIEYAGEDRTDGFTAADGTTATTTGYVSVTAVFFDGGVEVARANDVDAYEATVVNVEGTAAGEGSADGVDLRLDAGDTDVTLLRVGNVVPGDTGTSSGTLSNVGPESGTLRLSEVEYTSVENGLSEPESVDATGGDPGIGMGELHEALSLRIAIRRSDGSTDYVVGDSDAYVDLTTLAAADGIVLGDLDGGETRTLVVDWHVDDGAGNEIQTDSVDLSFAFTLTAEG
jgi:hypothetical protein